MKLKVLAASMALAFSSVGAQTTSTWETSEYTRSRVLAPVNASSAYARGWTGKGSNIAILDSGIDTSLSEFSNKIILVRDFSNSGGIFDRVGHGTHVAGIAAAAKNGVGMHGVAFDANLMIGKVTNSGIVISSTVLQGAQWASSMGADVANFSLNFTLSQSALAAKQISPGVYSTKFTNTGSLPGGLSASQWAAAVNSDMVLVVAAGNDATPWSGGLSQMATAVNSSGNLLLGGRMLVVGNWNSQGVTKNGVTTYSMGPNSNGAAHLCVAMVNNVCQDKYKAWEFYILAPGTGIYSTYPTAINKTGYSTMTGTSMAAPTVSGGVAIIHQMWPQMTGANIVKLLLVTANKNLPGYNVYTMGQGMMDLERATRPVGVVGVPTTGRLSGNKLANARPLIFTSGSASTGKLGNVMIVDDFERDFYIKGRTFTAQQQVQPKSAVQMAMPYLSGNNYSLYNNYTDFNSVANNNLEVKLYKNNESLNSPSMVEVAVTRSSDLGNLKFSGGVFTEQDTWLGNSVSGFSDMGVNKGSVTNFVGIGADKKFDSDTKIFANLTHGFTRVQGYSDNIKNIGTVLSYSWNLGVEQTVRNNTFGAMLYQPVAAYRANADVNVPTGLDENFNILSQSRVNLAADVKEYRLGLYHKFVNKSSVNTMTFIETRQNYRGQPGVKDTAVGITARVWF